MAASSSLYCSTGSTAVGFGAIVGAFPNPYGAAQLAATQFFTTGDQDLGGDGEVSGQTVFTAEFWYMTPTPTGLVEDIFTGPVTASSNRMWDFFTNSNGTLSFK